VADAPRFRIWPPVAFGVPFLLGLAVTWRLGDPVTLGIWARPAGFILVAFVIPWDAWALASMVRHRTAILPGGATTTLLTTGPFAISRNPLYVGFIGWHLALGLLLGSVWALVGLPIAILAVLWGAILPEESYLAQKFGSVYEDYRKRVRRWV
jgi:protein-S-isoprenylcysteine O-methyltransferase Ste14